MKKLIIFAIFLLTLSLSFASLDVNINDRTSEVVDKYLYEVLANVTILGNYSINDRYINISSAVVPQIENTISIKEDSSSAYYQGEVLTSTSLGGNIYEIHLDIPLDHPYGDTDYTVLGNNNWAVDGSVTPVSFIVSPEGAPDNVSWDITRVILQCVGPGLGVPDPVPDLTSFFTTDALTNGIYLRYTDGVTKNVFNAKSNAELELRTFDLTLNTNPNKDGLYSAGVRRTFNGNDKNGVVIRLDAATSDKFELVVQDDLTGMTKCNAVAQGHIVDYTVRNSVEISNTGDFMIEEAILVFGLAILIIFLAFYIGNWALMILGGILFFVLGFYDVFTKLPAPLELTMFLLAGILIIYQGIALFVDERKRDINDD